MGKGGGDIKETEYEKELAQIYAEEWQYYNEKIVPFENQVIDDATAANDKAVYDDISKAVTLGSQQSFGDASNRTLANMSASGINPNSNKFKATLSDLSDNQAASTSDTIARSEVAGQERYAGKLINVMAMGQGQSQEATATLGDIAQGAQRKAFSDSRISQQNTDALMGAAGALAGAAGSHYMNGQTTTASSKANPKT